MPKLINAAGLRLVKDFESCRTEAYQDMVGVWTIGYGHTEGVKEGDTITLNKAHTLLSEELEDYAVDVAFACTSKPNDNELAAMTSLAYNVGITGFRKSTVLKCHNRGDKDAAARAFAMWNKAGGKVVKGLSRRRAAEAALYLTPADGELEMPQQVDGEKPMTSSIQINAGTAAAATSAMGVLAQIAQSFKDIQEGFGVYLPYIAVGAACVAAIAGCVVVIERLRQRKRGEA